MGCLACFTILSLAVLSLSCRVLTLQVLRPRALCSSSQQRSWRATPSTWRCVEVWSLFVSIMMCESMVDMLGVLLACRQTPAYLSVMQIRSSFHHHHPAGAFARAPSQPWCGFLTCMRQQQRLAAAFNTLTARCAVVCMLWCALCFQTHSTHCPLSCVYAEVCSLVCVTHAGVKSQS